jgi:hypothetical protein
MGGGYVKSVHRRGAGESGEREFGTGLRSEAEYNGAKGKVFSG